MINFNNIARIETEDIVQIISEKRGAKKTMLELLQIDILDRYSKFIDIEENKRLISKFFTELEISAMHSLYDSKSNTARNIIDDITKGLNPNHSDFCLYCGIGEIDQIDHFLPKEHFPEFSIHHKNLIPICGKCNEIKGQNIPGDGDKDYLHLIFDMIPNENYHSCEIKYESTTPIVKFSILPKYQYNIVGRHFKSLKLAKRIEKKSIQYFLQIKALKKEFGIIYADEEISRDLQKTKIFFGEFYWKSALLTEMLNTNFTNKV